MAIGADRIRVENRQAGYSAVEIVQPGNSALPALNVGGNITVSGTVSGPGGVGLSKPTPYVFNLLDYGAVGDGQCVTDGAITSSSAVLTCATSKPFKSGDVGKHVLVLHAGATGVTTLVTTIAAVASSQSVTLANAAGATVSSGGCVLWATDDTAAWIAAVNAAMSFGAAFGAARVFAPIGSGMFYGIAGPPLTSGLGYAQIPIPVVSTPAGKIGLIIEGVGPTSAPQHWLQTTPYLTGTTLVSFGVYANATAQENAINAHGNPCVIGGPNQVNGYAQTSDTFSNVVVTLKDINILNTHSASGLTYSAWDFSGVASAALINHYYSTAATVVGSDYVSPNGFATGFSIGGLLPANGNNDYNYLLNVTCGGGYTKALLAPEHTTGDSVRILYSWAGLCPVGAYYGSNGASHGLHIGQLSIEGCVNHVYFVGQGQGGVGPDVVIDQLDTESAAPTITDDGNGGLAAATGMIRLAGLYTQTGISVTGPTNVDVISSLQTRGFVANPTYSLGTAFQNPWWRPAKIYLTGGTVTGVKIGATVGGSTAPTMHATGLTSGSFDLPSGAWMEIDGSVAPTMLVIVQ